MTPPFSPWRHFSGDEIGELPVVRHILGAMFAGGEMPPVLSVSFFAGFFLGGFANGEKSLILSAVS